MAIPLTEGGYNMYDMLSLLQKAIRRGKYEPAAFAANQLKKMFRGVLWSRMLVISAEDCFGILTKELINLKAKDDEYKSDDYLARAVALLCRAKKSRDACYFSCNFVLDTRHPRGLVITNEQKMELAARTERVRLDYGIIDRKKLKYDEFGFAQQSLYGYDLETPEEKLQNIEISKNLEAGVELQLALRHRDMDLIGYNIDILRKTDRPFMWSVFIDYEDEKGNSMILPEIIALKLADDFVNRNKQPGRIDEIFLAKSAMNICYSEDEKGYELPANQIVPFYGNIDWNCYEIKPITECALPGNKIPDYTFDCHTILGKKMGKTDWDMTRTEQDALYPLEDDYFSDASWIYTYEQDWRNNSISLKLIEEIRKNAETHPANPVKFREYREDELRGA